MILCRTHTCRQPLHMAPCTMQTARCTNRVLPSCGGANPLCGHASTGEVGEMVQGREVDGVTGACDKRRYCALAGHAGGQEGDTPYGGVGRPQPLHLLPRWGLQEIRLSRPCQQNANMNTILNSTSNARWQREESIILQSQLKDGLRRSQPKYLPLRLVSIGLLLDMTPYKEGVSQT